MDVRVTGIVVLSICALGASAPSNLRVDGQAGSLRCAPVSSQCAMVPSDNGIANWMSRIRIAGVMCAPADCCEG